MQACAFPDGVIHDHGNSACHEATAAVARAEALADAGVVGTLCLTMTCPVVSYIAPSDGRPRRCPACYGAG